MPGTPSAVGAGPAGIPPWWNAILQTLQMLQAQVAALTAGAQQTNIIDQYGNTIIVLGQLNQQVTIGAGYLQAGVQVTTGLPAAGKPNAGLAVQQGLVTTAITLTKGSAAATVASGSGLAGGMMIGAASVADASSGVSTPAITPGTSIQSITGTSVTLTAPAAESGTGVYCAACTFVSLQSFTYP